MSLTLRVELTVPGFMGTKRMLMVQLAPAATVPEVLPDGMQVVV